MVSRVERVGCARPGFKNRAELPAPTEPKRKLRLGVLGLLVSGLGVLGFRGSEV